jgi:hypothetical protein
VSESPQKLKRLIIDSATGQFLAPGGKWTPNEGEALDFCNIISAIAACGTFRIKKTAQVLVRFGDEKGFDIRLPLREEGGRHGAG